MIQFSLRDILWCASECERQHSGEMSVYWMCRGLSLARIWNANGVDAITTDQVRLLGTTIEPHLNRPYSYRRGSVFINNVPLMAPHLIDRAMLNLLSAQSVLTAKVFYREFETIHPFEDGNGRVGAILYNWRKGTLDAPETPPKYETL